MISAGYRTEIKEKFAKVLEGALKENPELGLIREIKTAKEWFSKSNPEKEPEKIMGMIIKLVIDCFSDNFVDELINSVGETIKKNPNSQEGRTISGFVPGIEASIPLMLYVNEIHVAGIDIGIYNNAGFVLHEINKLPESIGRGFHIKNVEINANLYFFVKMILSKKKKKIADYRFELNDMKILTQ